MAHRSRIYEHGKPYTEQDARLRVLDARTSSLCPDQTTEEYLIQLRIEVARWLEAIDNFILTGE